MLDHLRRHAEEIMARAERAILSTCGPADIQTGEFPCEAVGLRLYLRVPLASDHLFNLESRARVAVLGAGWHVQGVARPLRVDAAPSCLLLARIGDNRWTALVEVCPLQLHIEGRDGSDGETIDIEEGQSWGIKDDNA